MDRHVLVPLLKTVVLADVVQIVTPDDDGPLHLHLGHHTCKHLTVKLSTKIDQQCKNVNSRGGPDASVLP